MSVDTTITETTRPSNRSDPGITTKEGTTNYFSVKTHPDETPSTFQIADGVLSSGKPYASTT